MPGGATRAGITWVLALVFLALIGAGFTRTRLLWGKTTFEETRDPARLTFAHTYQAARQAECFVPDGRRAVVLLGNSRAWLGARESYLQPELDRLTPGLRAVNLAIDGARLKDQAALARHLGRLEPALVVVTLAGADLVGPPAGLPATLLGDGWDGPIRTLWPLFRVREFVRAALVDRVAPDRAVRPFPPHFRSTTDMFAFFHGEQATVVEEAYRRWRDRPTLDAFVAYLTLARQDHLDGVRRRVAEAAAPDPSGPAVAALDTLLARLGAGGRPAMVVLMPENPILRLDTRGEWRRPGFAEAAAAAIRATADRHDVVVVDGRGWLTADAFLDFDNPMPDLSSVQKPLAREIVGVLGA